MGYSIIRLQEDRVIQVSAAVGGINGTYRQEPSRAVNVSAFQYVTPWLRVIQDSNNLMPATSMAPVNFKFYSAPLFFPEDAVVTNSVGPPTTPTAPQSDDTRADSFVDCGSSAVIQITSSINSTTHSFMRTMAWSGNSGFAAIVNPGGLMLFEIQNTNSSSGMVRFELYLVCRGAT